jgi:hypothetical protein
MAQDSEESVRPAHTSFPNLIAATLGEVGRVDLVCGHSVQDGRAGALEDRELVGVLASGNGTGRDVAEFEDRAGVEQAASIGATRSPGAATRIEQRPSVDVL